MKNDQPVASFDVPTLIVTTLLVAFAAGLVIAQFYYAQDPTSQLSLANLYQRVPVLSQITDPVQREQYDIPLSHSARRLAAALPPDARIFMSDMTGHTNQPALGYYYFFRNYLFPRDLEISLDKGHFGKGGYFGTSTDDPEVARTNGFDVMIRMSDGQLIPLTAKGVPNAGKSP